MVVFQKSSNLIVGLNYSEISFSFCLKSEKNEHVLLVCLIEQVGASVGAVLLGLTHV